MPVIPSATTAESRLSIEQRIAIVIADGIRSRTIPSENCGMCGTGRLCGMPPNRVPIVSTNGRVCTPSKVSVAEDQPKSETITALTITATIAPGTRGSRR